MSATMQPTTATIHPAGGLFGKRSVLGGLFVLAVLSFFGFGLQAIDDAVRRADQLEVGARTQVTDLVSFVAAPGWANDPTQTQPGIAVVAEKDGWQMKLAGGIVLQPGQTIDDWAKLFYDIPPPDPGAQVGELTSFTTDTGLPGLMWETHGSTRSSATFFVANGSDLAQILAEGPASAYDGVEADLMAMATSIDITSSTEEAP